MLERQSLHRVPDQLTQLCSVTVKSKRDSYLDLCQKIEQDDFLSVYLRSHFKEHWSKGGVMTLIKSLGWESLRDRIAEAFLHQFVYRKFPISLEVELAQDNIDFVRRFEFLSTSGNQRTYLLGHLLNQTNLDLEEQGLSVLIPLEVDTILAKYKSRSSQPDWLIVATWGLVEILGMEKADQLLVESGGKWNLLEKELSETQMDKFIGHLLAYGFAIDDQSFFVTETV